MKDAKPANLGGCDHVWKTETVVAPKEKFFFGIFAPLWKRCCCGGKLIRFSEWRFRKCKLCRHSEWGWVSDYYGCSNQCGQEQLIAHYPSEMGSVFLQ